MGARNGWPGQIEGWRLGIDLGGSRVGVLVWVLGKLLCKVCDYIIVIGIIALLIRKAQVPKCDADRTKIVYAHVACWLVLLTLRNVRCLLSGLTWLTWLTGWTL